MFLAHKDRATVLSQNNNEKKYWILHLCWGETTLCWQYGAPWNELFDKAQWKNNIVLLFSSAVCALFVRW